MLHGQQLLLRQPGHLLLLHPDLLLLHHALHCPGLQLLLHPPQHLLLFQLVAPLWLLPLLPQLLCWGASQHPCGACATIVSSPWAR
jgi:hypothetical protein